LKKNCTKYVQKIRRRKMTVFELIEANGLNLHGDIEHFAALVAEHEREACADIAENWNSNGSPRVGVAAQIRARGTT
jgi:hypothetical protein